MKKFLCLIFLLAQLLSGCASREATAEIAATTLPVYEFTARIVRGTPLTVTRLVTEQVSCLHDYALNVRQVKAAEAAEIIVISGAGLEEFMEDLLDEAKTVDASQGIELLCGEEDHQAHEGHHHEEDPHIWLDPSKARDMARNICNGLIRKYPQYDDIFRTNLEGLLADLSELQAYGQQQLRDVTPRELITFHDGFSYFAAAFDLDILKAVEEESGSEASARELIELIQLVDEHQLPAIFTERSGSTSAASIISRETGASLFALDMAMAGDSYFDAMKCNIDTIKEAFQ